MATYAQPTRDEKEERGTQRPEITKGKFLIQSPLVFWRPCTETLKV